MSCHNNCYTRAEAFLVLRSWFFVAVCRRLPTASSLGPFIAFIPVEFFVSGFWKVRVDLSCLTLPARVEGGWCFHGTKEVFPLQKPAEFGDRTTVRKANGATVATAEVSGNRVIYRAPNGATMGTASTSGDSSVFRKSNGSTSCTSQTFGSQTTFRASNGATRATATQTGSTIAIHKLNGTTAGTVSLSH